MTTTRTPIDWDALEIAVERNAPDADSYLDRTTGQVLTVIAGDPEALVLKRRIADAIHNFVRVEPAASREQYRWMERFTTSVSDPQLRERLIISIDGKGAFRRFKDVLLAYPVERERWFGYRADLLHWHIHGWLADNDVVPAEAPPWGEAKPPPELPLAEGLPVVHGTEPPGEALRRQARDLIDGIAAIELPSAIAFLEFLRERGAQALVGGREAPAASPPASAAEPAGAATSAQPRGTSREPARAPRRPAAEPGV
jgi:hypothetical protein